MASKNGDSVTDQGGPPRRKVISIGDSVGFTIPKDTRDKHEIEEGDEVVWENKKQGKKFGVRFE